MIYIYIWGIFEINNPEFIEQVMLIYWSKERILSSEIVDNITLWKINSIMTVKNFDDINSWIDENSKLVLIWIDDYIWDNNDLKWDNNDLKWAINDIELAKETISKIYWIKKSNIIVLTNDDANKNSILQTLSKESENTNSKMIVYYAWHWINLENTSYMAPSDSDFNNKWTLISSEEFNNAIKSNALIITDMCYAWWFINNLSDNISWVWSSKYWVAWEIQDKDWKRTWEFSFEFLNLLNSWKNIEESLEGLANKVNT